MTTHTQLSTEVIKNIGTKQAFTEAVNTAVASYNNAAGAIAKLAILAIEHYHVNSFNGDYAAIVHTALQNNPKLLKGFNLMLADMTLLNDECQPKKLKGNSRSKAKKAIEARKESFIEQVNQDGFTLTKYVSVTKYEQAKTEPKKAPKSAAKTGTENSDKEPSAASKIKQLSADIEAMQKELLVKCTELNALQKEAGLPQSETMLQELAGLKTAYAAMAKKADNFEKLASDNSNKLDKQKVLTAEAHNKVQVLTEQVEHKNALIESILSMVNSGKATKLGQAILKLVA